MFIRTEIKLVKYELTSSLSKRVLTIENNPSQDLLVFIFVAEITYDTMKISPNQDISFFDW